VNTHFIYYYLNTSTKWTCLAPEVLNTSIKWMHYKSEHINKLNKTTMWIHRLTSSTKWTHLQMYYSKIRRYVNIIYNRQSNTDVGIDVISFKVIIITNLSSTFSQHISVFLATLNVLWYQVHPHKRPATTVHTINCNYMRMC